MSIQSIQNAYTCTHVSAHNFLNIQWIFNPKKVLECWESGLSNHSKILICRYCRYKSIIFQCNSVLVMSTRSILSTYRIWWYCWKALVLSISKHFSGLKIRWILRKLWAETCVHNIAFEAWLVLWSLVSTVSTWDTTHNALLSMLWS